MQERLSMCAIARILCLSLGMVYKRITDILDPFGDMFEMVNHADYEHFSSLSIPSAYRNWGNAQKSMAANREILVFVWLTLLTKLDRNV